MRRNNEIVNNARASAGRCFLILSVLGAGLSLSWGSLRAGNDSPMKRSGGDDDDVLSVVLLCANLIPSGC